jgi:hypothetical protein
MRFLGWLLVGWLGMQVCPSLVGWAVNGVVIAMTCLVLAGGFGLLPGGRR